MGFRLGTIDGRAVLVDEELGWHDLGRVVDDGALADPLTALAEPDRLHAASAGLDPAAADGTVEEASLGPPVPAPRQVFGIGLNYRSHAEESGMALPPSPLVFAKYLACITGPDATVELRGDTVDYEAELVVVIGPGGRDVAPDAAWDHVAGLTVGQDLSDRTLQFASAPPHFDLGKSRDGYGPIGPLVVSPDLVPDRDDLAITCDVGGDRRQDDRTSGLIFDVPALVSYLSSILTLHPGDLVFTGTPAGVGMATGRFLRPGDEIVSTIEGVGTLVTHCA